MQDASETFDNAAEEYESQLEQGISLSGESADFFVEGRLAKLAELMESNSAVPGAILDFGCGIGNAAEGLLRLPKATSYLGYDCSEQSIEVARGRELASGLTNRIDWTTDAASLGKERFDLAYTSGVFHHIEPDQRDAELKRVFQALRPGGYFGFFENNPWNPGTRWVMSRIPFDRDAICLPIPEAKRRLRIAGFERVAVRTLFFFPRTLGWLRSCEGSLEGTPLGAQYLILVRKPLGSPSAT
ncbi:MAG: class I SAM-dependent methyltransferase [Aureliella sp.]